MSDRFSFLAQLDDKDIILDTASLILSALDYDNISFDPYIDLLKSIGDEIEFVSSLSSGSDIAATLVDVIAYKFGFSGKRAIGDSRLSAGLMPVIDRREGPPTSLAILYVSAARRMGWVADVVSLPPQILVRVGPADHPRFIDPSTGKIHASAPHLSGGPASRWLAKIVPANDNFIPISNRAPRWAGRRHHMLGRECLERAIAARPSRQPLRLEGMASTGLPLARHLQTRAESDHSGSYPAAEK